MDAQKEDYAEPWEAVEGGKCDFCGEGRLTCTELPSIEADVDDDHVMNVKACICARCATRAAAVALGVAE